MKREDHPRCSICKHSDVERIERLLSGGASLKACARKFALAYHSLRRHARNHLTAEQRAKHIAGAALSRDELAEEVADESIGYLDHYRITRGHLYRGIRVADEAKDLSLLSGLVGRLHENLRDSARLTGDLQRGPLLAINQTTVNFLANPDAARAVACIVSAVAPYPEARAAVVAALRVLDAASGALTIEHDG
jgi:hypothetical protein